MNCFLRNWSATESACLPYENDLLPIENVAYSMLLRKQFILTSAGETSDFRTKDALRSEPYYELKLSSVCELMDSSKADKPFSQTLFHEVKKICQMECVQLEQPNHSCLRKIVDEMSIFTGKNPIVSGNFLLIIIYYVLFIIYRKLEMKIIAYLIKNVLIKTVVSAHALLHNAKSCNLIILLIETNEHVEEPVLSDGEIIMLLLDLIYV